MEKKKKRNVVKEKRDQGEGEEQQQQRRPTTTKHFEIIEEELSVAVEKKKKRNGSHLKDDDHFVNDPSPCLYSFPSVGRFPSSPCRLLPSKATSYTPSPYFPRPRFPLPSPSPSPKPVYRPPTTPVLHAGSIARLFLDPHNALWSRLGIHY
ncbi:unnamed protein product [Microthlaspi erraticum]|uniref:Uncharacterized protein n=1 Tax=Microthlaspi erraticum TaxID=1685480 RepID=A0A6D2ICQ6_9BRAS|nr:unnamed protein product [Microthlaspi erraticum]